MTDSTLGGYLEVHSRPPAFEGGDGHAYTVDVWVDEEPDDSGNFGAALLFVRWTPEGSKPRGHLETRCLARAQTAEGARATLTELTLHQVKRHLDSLIEASREIPDW